MRKALFDYLTANCQSIPAWYQPGMADAKTAKPYGVIVIGEVMRSPVNRRGAFRDVYIWPYFGGSSYIVVDEAIAEIKALLDGKVLAAVAGASFEVEYVGEGRDFRDPDLQALTRRIDFRIPIVV